MSLPSLVLRRLLQPAARNSEVKHNLLPDKDFRQNCRCSQLLQKRAIRAHFPSKWLQVPASRSRLPVPKLWASLAGNPARRSRVWRCQACPGNDSASVSRLPPQSLSAARLGLHAVSTLSLRQVSQSGRNLNNECCDSDVRRAGGWAWRQCWRRLRVRRGLWTALKVACLGLKALARRRPLWAVAAAGAWGIAGVWG